VSAKRGVNRTQTNSDIDNIGTKEHKSNTNKGGRVKDLTGWASFQEFRRFMFIVVSGNKRSALLYKKNKIKKSVD